MIALILGTFAFLLLIGTPIAFVLGAVGLVVLVATTGTNLLFLVPQQIFAGMNSFILMAIPLFILSGELMNAVGITERIVKFTDATLGSLKGGLGHVNIVANIFFAGISGAAVADAAALGAMLIPAMEKSGYSKSYATALTAASAIIGPTIPPSIPMIIYGSIANVSIAGLFAAGLLPGLLMGLLLMVANYYISSIRGYQASRASSKGEIWNTFKGAVLALGMPVVILGGILSGIFTPTEAAGVAVAYALVVGVLLYRTLKWDKTWEIIKKTVYSSGVALLLVSVGGILSWVLAYQQIPQLIANTILSFAGSKYVFLFISAVFLLFVGCVMDLTASIIILAPILAPIATALGINPYHFGITMVVALNIGLNTPPVGAVLFVVASITDQKMEPIIKEIWPFLLCQFATLALVVFIPAISVSIPRLIGLQL